MMSPSHCDMTRRLHSNLKRKRWVVMRRGGVGPFFNERKERLNNFAERFSLPNFSIFPPWSSKI